jgi:anti-sigma factor RsiW
MAKCMAPIPEETLLDYWARDLADGDEAERVEEHLFACDDCSTHLQQLATLGAGLATLARQGRLSGVVSRTILNRLQRDGLHVRTFSLSPGETVPCAVFPGDDLVVAALRADFSGVDAVTLTVTGPDSSTMDAADNVPVSGLGDEVLWVTPAARIRELPSMRLQLTLASTGPARAEVGRYVLEHTAF